MKAVNDHIRSLRIRILRKIWMKSKMCAMRLIHDQRDPFSMHDICDLTDIRNHSVVSRRCDHDCTNIMILFQNTFHILRTDLPVQSCIFNKFRINIDWMQFIQVHCIVH